MKRPPWPFGKRREPEPGNNPEPARTTTAPISTPDSPAPDRQERPERQDRVGRKPIDIEALNTLRQALAAHSAPSPRIDPTSLGNLAHRAGVPSFVLDAALRVQAEWRGSPTTPRLGQLLVSSGALSPRRKTLLLSRQAAMRQGRPSLQDALELLGVAIDRALAIAGLTALPEP